MPRTLFPHALALGLLLAVPPLEAVVLERSRPAGAAGLEAILCLSADPMAFFDAWEDGDDAVVFEPADSLELGDVLVSLLVFAGCEGDGSGLCRLVADFAFLRPDGTVRESAAGVDLWPGLTAPEAGWRECAAGSGVLLLGSADPTGTWTARATVRDLVSGSAVELEQVFEVVPMAPRQDGRDDWESDGED